MTEEQQTGWDSRERWTAELVYRIHQALDADQGDVKGWFERVADFYDIASCAVDDLDGYEAELDRIEQLIYAVKIDGRVLTDRDRRQRREQAYKHLRRFFRALHKEIYSKGLLIPFRQVYDEVEGFKGQFK